MEPTKPTYLCFLCNGLAKKECVDARLYVPYGDHSDCIYSAIAKEDLKKLDRKDIKAISLRIPLAEYLKITNDQRTLDVLI